VLDPELATFLEHGVAVIVGTRSAGLVPAVTRGWGPSLDVGAATLDVCVAAGPGSATLSNLDDNATAAVTCSRPSDYRSVQFKGVVTGRRAPDDDDRARAELHVSRFVDEVVSIGLPATIDALFFGELVAVRIDVREVYEQTPGRGAGRAL
jgi:hypothetical protein